MALDAVFIGAHPDDVELTCGGLAARLASHGHAVGLVDLTAGEMGTRGTPAIRAEEAQQAARELGVASRECLGLPDCGLDRHDRGQITAVVTMLRRLRPGLVVAPDPDDVHPDHVEGARLVARACHLAGLLRFEAPYERFRPRLLLHAIYRGSARPQLVVDVTATWDRRMAALRAHRSQLAPDAGPSTYLTAPEFLAEVEARARVFGALAGCIFGEGYRARGPVVLHDAHALLAPRTSA